MGKPFVKLEPKQEIIFNTSPLSQQKKLHSPIINIEQPVEAHINAERNVDQNGPLLLQPLVDGSQAMNHLHNIHHVLPLLQLLLPKHVYQAAQRHQIHWKQHTSFHFKYRYKALTKLKYYSRKKLFLYTNEKLDSCIFLRIKIYLDSNQHLCEYNSHNIQNNLI